MRILGVKPCVIPTWNVMVFSHSSSAHKVHANRALGKPPGNGGVVPPWLEPPANLIPLPGPQFRTHHAMRGVMPAQTTNHQAEKGKGNVVVVGLQREGYENLSPRGVRHG